jgi:hypothetical protein
MSNMFYEATAFNQDLCAWRDSFPYNKATSIFEDSGCTWKTRPDIITKSPFCASTCEVSLLKI